jgi:hypothetical protein
MLDISAGGFPIKLTEHFWQGPNTRRIQWCVKLGCVAPNPMSTDASLSGGVCHWAATARCARRQMPALWVIELQCGVIDYGRRRRDDFHSDDTSRGCRQPERRSQIRQSTM